MTFGSVFGRTFSPTFQPKSQAAVAASTFVPTDITGLTLWFDFSDADTLFTDAGSTKVANDGDLIYQANDKSGNSYHVTQVYETKRPDYKINIINGLSAAYFDGDDFLVRNSVSMSQPDTIFMAANVTAPKYLFDGGGARQLAEVHNAGGSNYDLHMYAGTSVYSTARFSIPTNIIFCYVFNGANSYLRINNNTIESKSPGTSSLNGMYIGARYGGTNNHVGHIFEMIGYSGALSSNDIDIVINYLNNKWTIY